MKFFTVKGVCYIDDHNDSDNNNVNNDNDGNDDIDDNLTGGPSYKMRQEIRINPKINDDDDMI